MQRELEFHQRKLQFHQRRLENVDSKLKPITKMLSSQLQPDGTLTEDTAKTGRMDKNDIARNTCAGQDLPYLW